MTSRNGTTHPIATTATSMRVAPVAAWMTSTAGAINEAAASIARRIDDELDLADLNGFGDVAHQRMEHRAAAHRNDATSRPALRICPV